MDDLTNIIDTPLSNASEDKLDTKKYVQGLAQYLRQSSMPTTVAIQGQWGAGKTSFMNQLRSILCETGDGCDPQYFGVWINMWEYSLMQTPEKTLISVIKGMIKECTKILAQLNAPSAVVEELKQKAWSFFKKTGSVIASTAVKAGANAVGLDGDAAAAVFSEEDFNETNPQEFRDAFANTVEKCLSSQPEGKPRRRGFMFFIDDLDRINPENAVQILELLKNMFEVSNCIFVLAIDYDVVVKGLKTKFGSTSSDDDRAFRSFFDKIIQMPFSMPIGAYDITSFLEDSLKNIGYFSANELRKEVKLIRVGQEGEEEITSETVISVVDEMTRMSTGTNPRSIKRLINTLSLIKIISNIQSQESEEEEPLSEYDYLMNYGLVCLQIAYPQIYDRIIEEPNYLSWDDDTARQFRLARLTDEKKELLDIATEFNEDWEKVVYRICMTSSYLLISALNISSLLNLIRALYPRDQFERKINKMLGMTSVTSVTSVAKSEMISEKHQATLDTRRSYWSEFLDYAFAHPEFARVFRRGKASQQNYQNFNLRGAGCSLLTVMNISKNELRVDLYMSGKHDLYRKLLSNKDAIEAEAGLTFDWHESGGKADFIRARDRDNSFNLSNHGEWHKQFDWMMDVMLRMRNTFTKYICDILA